MSDDPVAAEAEVKRLRSLIEDANRDCEARNCGCWENRQ